MSIVVDPPLVDGILVIKQVPAVIVCKYDQPTQLGALLLGGFPGPVISGLPWPIGPTYQGFIFPKVSAGNHFLFLFDLQPPGLFLSFLQVRVEEQEFGGISPSAPTNGQCFTDNWVWAHGSTDADPHTIVGTMTCNLGHTFAQTSLMAMAPNWYISFNVNEATHHQTYTFSVQDSSGVPVTVSNLKVNAPGGCP